jgi:RNA polymerase sigma-32 factor
VVLPALLGADEERDLVRRAEGGDQEALSRLVTCYLPFVVKIARSYRGWGLPMNDLVQEGTIGLLQAVRRFDPNRGARLSTYAVWWIRSAIQEYVLRSWSLVRIGTTNAQKALALRLKRIVGDVVGSDLGGAEDLMSGLAKRFGTTAAEVVALARRLAGRDSSLDSPRPGSAGLFERLSSDWPSPEQLVSQISEHRHVSAALNRALAMLSPRERLVIRRRYFEDVKHTFDAIGRELGLSKDRVRQLESSALAKLRNLLSPMQVEFRS